MTQKRPALGIVGWFLISLIAVIFLVLVSLFKFSSSTEKVSSPAQLSTVFPTKIVVDLPSIAGKKKAQVDSVLENPSFSGWGEHIMWYSYRNGKIRIGFINGKSDWITIESLDSIPFMASSIKAFGLPLSTPTLSTGNSFIWKNYPNIKEISLVKELKGNWAESVYIYVATVPELGRQ
jgi:hypothetical protein